MLNSDDSVVTVRVRDVPDVGVVARTEEAIRRVFTDVPTRGRWTVSLGASDTRGRWDIVLTGPAERHVLSFTSPRDRVPDLAAEYVKRAIARLKGR